MIHWGGRVKYLGCYFSSPSGEVDLSQSVSKFYGSFNMRAKFGAIEQTHGIRSRAKFSLDRFILSPSGGENPQFLPFFELRHFVVSPQLRTTTNLPLSNGIKIISVLQLLHGEIGRTNFDVQPNKHTNKETQPFCPPPGGG